MKKDTDPSGYEALAAAAIEWITTQRSTPEMELSWMKDFSLADQADFQRALMKSDPKIYRELGFPNRPVQIEQIQDMEKRLKELQQIGEDLKIGNFPQAINPKLFENIKVLESYRLELQENRVPAPEKWQPLILSTEKLLKALGNNSGTVLVDQDFLNALGLFTNSYQELCVEEVGVHSDENR